MNTNRNLGSARQSTAELWRETLRRTPTVFGRLAYLAKLRDPATRQYVHPALSRTLGPEEADLTLRHSHQQVFVEWLALGLAEQKADLDEFFTGIEGPLQAARYRDLAPQSAHDVERQLYLSDLETLLALLNFERENPSRTPRS